MEFHFPLNQRPQWSTLAMYFTLQERTVRNKTVGQALEQASKVLFSMHGVKEVCTNAVRESPKTEITTEQMSRLVEQIVDDSLYYKR